YSTSPAYHKAYENTERYKALQFAEGHPAQIEFAGVLSSSRNRDLAEKFVEYLISPECQAFLPETQWMFPVNRATRLPDSFRVVSKFPVLKAQLGDLERDPMVAAELLKGVR
ncbi:MAG: ABC transporter substrate-binding protein, partial [Rectinema sp.]|nr:ABC transporter substrate-binding protein [Rectinema sp.]